MKPKIEKIRANGSIVYDYSEVLTAYLKHKGFRYPKPDGFRGSELEPEPEPKPIKKDK